jgi:hypothetical protein
MSIDKALRGTQLLNDQDTESQYALYDFTEWSDSNNSNSNEANYIGTPKDRVEDVDLSLHGFSANKPIALLPVKLETKFIGQDLWIRIFPDQIFVKSHEKALTNDEVSDGQTYWLAYNAADGQISAQQEAWRKLCVKYGVNRAAWIISQLFPTNVIHPPTSPQLAEIIGLCEASNDDLNSFSNAYAGPKDLIDFVHDISNDLTNSSTLFTADRINIVDDAEVFRSGVEQINAYYKSIRDTGINPLLADGGLTDRALLGPCRRLEKSISNAFKQVEFDVVDIPVKLNLDELSAQLSRFRYNGRVANEISLFLQKIKLEFDALLLTVDLNAMMSSDLLSLSSTLGDFETDLLMNYDRFNPVLHKNPEGTESRREDAAAQILLDIISAIDAFTVDITFSQPDVSVIHGNWKALKGKVRGKSVGKMTGNEQLDFLVELEANISDVVATGLTLANATPQEVISVWKYMMAVKRQFDSSLDELSKTNNLSPNRLNLLRKSAIKPVKDASLQIGALIPSLTTVIESVWDTKTFLHNTTAQDTPKEWLDEVGTHFTALSSRVGSIWNTGPEGPVLKSLWTDLYEDAISTYYKTVNPPIVADQRSEPGIHGDYTSELNQIKLTYRSALLNLFASAPDRQTSLMNLFSIEDQLQALQPEYTTPGEVKSAMQNWQLNVQNIRSLASNGNFRSEEIEIIADLANGLKTSLQNKIDEQFSPLKSAVGGTMERRNTEWQSTASAILEDLSVLSKGDGLVPSNPQDHSGFSFTFTGEAPAFPVVETKDSTWTIQQYSDVLPKRFVAIGLSEADDTTNVQDNIKFIRAGNPVKQDIKFGFNPNDVDTTNEDGEVIGESANFTFKIDSNGDLIAHENLEWLINKEKALEHGLAIKVPVGNNDYFSRILVLGVNDDDAFANPAAQLERHKELLEELFANHQYTTGVSLLTAGTATNNTEDEQSGYTTDNGLNEKSFGIFAQDRLFIPSFIAENITDGQRFSELLGLPYSSLYHVEGAEKKSISNGKIGAAILYPGTIGLHLEEALDKLFSYEDRKQIRTFFNENVSARGLAPSFRIGKQPYGLLVASHLHNYKIQNEDQIKSFDDFLSPGNSAYNANDMPFDGIEGMDGYSDLIIPSLNTGVFSKSDWQARFHVRIKQVMQFLDIEWRRLAQRFAKNIYTENSRFHKEQYQTLLTLLQYQGQGMPTDLEVVQDYAQQHFMDVFGLLPYSQEFAVRFSTATGSFESIRDILGTNVYDVSLGIGDLLSDSESGIHPLTADRMKNMLLSLDRSGGYEKVLDFMKSSKLTKGIFTDADHSSIKGPNPAERYATENGDALAEWIKSTRAFRTTSSDEYIMLSDNRIKGPEGTITPQSYLQWLKDAHPAEIYNNNDFGNLSSNSLLFLLVRSSLLATYREKAAELFVSERLLPWSAINALGTPEKGIRAFGTSAIASSIVDDNHLDDFMTVRWKMTKWNLLFDKLWGNHPFFMTEEEQFDHADSNANLYTSYADLSMNLLGASGLQDLPWRDSELLKYLMDEYAIPGVNPAEGIFDVPKEFANDNRKTIADYLHTLPNGFSTMVTVDIKAQVSHFRAMIDLVSQMDERELERIVGENADLASNRLDAWIHGLFNMRLTALRNRRRNVNEFDSQIVFDAGSHIGAYGYIENLKKTTANGNAMEDTTDPTIERRALNDTSLIQHYQLPEANGAAVFEDLNNQGFLPAPSLTHAVTAAILRSGYMAGKVLNDSSVFNRSAVNLTSARIRKALFILRGIQAGNSLGALLGQQFEKGLHENYVFAGPESSDNIELDVYIHRLRKLFPLRQASADQIEDQSVAGEVLDGMALLEAVTGSELVILPPDKSIYEYFVSGSNLNILGQLGWGDAMPSETASRKAMAFHIDQLAQTLDALGDLVVTESVYQIAQGNVQRAAAFADIMSGSSAFTEPEVILSPMRSNYFQNRILLNMDVNATSHWSETASPRKTLDPALNAWITSILGNAANIHFAIEYKETTEGETVTTTDTLLMDELDVEPIDLLSTIQSANTSLSLEMERIIIHRIKKLHPTYFDVKILQDELGTEIQGISIQNVMPVLCRIKYVLENARPILDTDFKVSEAINENGGINKVDYHSRVNQAFTELQNLYTAITDFEGISNDMDCTVVLQMLGKAFDIGVQGILPNTAMAYNPTQTEFRNEILARLEVAETLIKDRLEKATVLLGNYAPTLTEKNLLAEGNKILQLVFGGPAYCLPRITLSDASLADAIGNRANILPENESHQLDIWLHANAQIRRHVAAAVDLQVFKDVVQSDTATTPLNFEPIQIPHQQSDRWLGLPLQEEQNLAGKCSILLSNAGLLEGTTLTTGLKLDDWQEAIPTESITGGIAMHFNQPGAEAPQNIIVAIPNSEENNWKWNLNDLAHSVLQAFDMAKYRALEPENIGQDSRPYNLADFDGSQEPLPANHLGKIFPANMVDVFPVSGIPDPNGPVEDAGIKVSMNYTVNNENN